MLPDSPRTLGGPAPQPCRATATAVLCCCAGMSAAVVDAGYDARMQGYFDDPATKLLLGQFIFYGKREDTTSMDARSLKPGWEQDFQRRIKDLEQQGETYKLESPLSRFAYFIFTLKSPDHPLTIQTVQRLHQIHFEQGRTNIDVSMWLLQRAANRLDNPRTLQLVQREAMQLGGVIAVLPAAQRRPTQQMRLLVLRPASPAPPQQLRQPQVVACRLHHAARAHGTQATAIPLELLQRQQVRSQPPLARTVPARQHQPQVPAHRLQRVARVHAGQINAIPPAQPLSQRHRVRL